MKTVLKITMINLVIILLYFIVFRLVINSIPFRGTLDFRMMNVIYPMMIQIVANLGLSIHWFVKKNNELGLGFLLSIMVVLLVGFSMCSFRF